MVVGNADRIGVHKRLAAGAADRPGQQPTAFDFIEVLDDFGRSPVDAPFVFGEDSVAMSAGQAAERA